MASTETKPDWRAWFGAYRMRDYLFFPLAGVLALMMVGLALSPALGRLPEGAMAGDGLNYERIVIEGAYLNKVQNGGKSKTELMRGADGTYALYIEADANALNDAPELGPHFRLAADVEQQFSGRKIRCTVRARPATDKGAQQIALNYSSGRAGNSGWRVFDLQAGSSDAVFEFDVPVIVGDQGFDYFAIRPVVPEKSRALIIERITFERLPAQP